MLNICCCFPQPIAVEKSQQIFDIQNSTWTKQLSSLKENVKEMFGEITFHEIMHASLEII